MGKTQKLFYECDGFGEPSFSAASWSGGWGDMEVNDLWSRAGLQEAPSGFRFIVDAEHVAVALVPRDLAQLFIKFMDKAYP